MAKGPTYYQRGSSDVWNFIRDQDLRMRILEDRLNQTYYDHKKDIITLFLALQSQNFVLGNSLTNLLKKWTTIEEEASRSGISFVIKT